MEEDIEKEIEEDVENVEYEILDTKNELEKITGDLKEK